MNRTIQIGVTTKCNAKCYMCFRNLERYCIPHNIELPIEAIEKLIPHFNLFVFIGCFGDFICHSKSLEIVNLLSDKNIHIDTNGSLHGKEYWTELGKSPATVRFCIDDIEGKTDRYRKTDIRKTLQNLEWFMEAGGKAKMKTVLFNFNQHQNISELYDIPHITEFSRNYEDEGDFSRPDNFIKHVTTNPHVLYVDELGTLHRTCIENFKITGLLSKTNLNRLSFERAYENLFEKELEWDKK